MKRNYGIIILFYVLFLAGLPCTVQAQAGFQKIMAATAGDYQGNDAIEASDGGYIIVGSSQSDANYFNIYVVKTDVNGNYMWANEYGGGGSAHEFGYSIKETYDNGFIILGMTEAYAVPGCGIPCPDVFLIRIDSIGDVLWSKAIGGAQEDYGYDVQETSDSGFIVTGYTKSFGAGNADVYLIRTDMNGDTLWTRTYGGTDKDYGHSVQQTSEGGFIVTGYTKSYGAGNADVYLLKTDANGDTLWTKTYGGDSTDVANSVQQTSDGGYILVGYSESFLSVPRTLYLVKTDSLGNLLWARGCTYFGWDEGKSVKIDSVGNYLIGGSSGVWVGSNVDVFLLKTDNLGNKIWSYAFGGLFGDFGNSLYPTSDNMYLIAGTTYSFDNFSRYHLIKTDALGNGGGCYEYIANSFCQEVTLLTSVGSGAIVGSTTSIVNDTMTSYSQLMPGIIDLCDTVTSIVQGAKRYNQIGVYPNPTKGLITLNTLSENGDVRATVYNVLGELVYNNFFIDNNIDLSDLSSGVYIIHIAHGTTIYRERIIKL
ncbi:MAG: hypothetical protein COB85_08120 [Bacteroidetes bacterium]|nr:MAG: hypothetical protein COB85_08120 [Bacteroidota bacterium]